MNGTKSTSIAVGKRAPAARVLVAIAMLFPLLPLTQVGAAHIHCRAAMRLELDGGGEASVGNERAYARGHAYATAASSAHATAVSLRAPLHRAAAPSHASAIYEPVAPVESYVY